MKPIYFMIILFSLITVITSEGPENYEDYEDYEDEPLIKDYYAEIWPKQEQSVYEPADEPKEVEPQPAPLQNWDFQNQENQMQQDEEETPEEFCEYRLIRNNTGQEYQQGLFDRGNETNFKN